MVSLRHIVALFLAGSSAAGAQGFPIADAANAVRAGNSILTDFSDYEIDVGAIQAPPSLDEWRVFWAPMDRALREGSFNDLAAMLPEVRAAVSRLDAVPEAAPYVSWLRQRLDYFMAAQEAESSGGSLSRPVPAMRVSAMVRDAGTWKRRVGQHPPPESADKLIPVLKEVFRDQGVPHQLVWLAEVESSLDTEALSPSGAAGLFQFMPDTAKRFGLQLEPRDERLEPEKSARAAAQYLRLLHATFGSWPLAIAAYNAGEGAVGRLLEKKHASTFEDIAPFLPAETQMYVPKVLATVSVREGIDATHLPAPTTQVALLGGTVP